MTLDEAIRRNPYNLKKGNEAAYCRYLRYNVDGWYQLDSKEVRRRWQKVRCRMQIVINIDDEDYDDITLTGENTINLGVLLDLREAVRNGTPLPKGHGAIKDVSQIEIPMCEDRAYERRNIMIEKIGRPAMLEQLAEEASELAQACLKLARKERGENPTPKSKAECERELIEEFTDVIQCARELKLKPDEEQIEEKAQRFLTRWIANTQSDIEKKKHKAEK